MALSPPDIGIDLDDLATLVTDEGRIAPRRPTPDLPQEVIGQYAQDIHDYCLSFLDEVVGTRDVKKNKVAAMMIANAREAAELKAFIENDALPLKREHYRMPPEARQQLREKYCQVLWRGIQQLEANVLLGYHTGDKEMTTRGGNLKPWVADLRGVLSETLRILRRWGQLNTFEVRAVEGEDSDMTGAEKALAAKQWGRAEEE